MKRYYTLLSLVLFNFSLIAQVGINTDKPASGTILHVDAGKDNNSTTLTQVQKDANDVVVTTSGSIGIGTTSPDASAAFEIKSTERGILIPRMLTAERNGITNPISGLTIYNKEQKCFQTYVSSRSPTWQCNNATINGRTPNISVSSFTFNNPTGAGQSEVCVGTICVRHTGAPTGAYLEIKSNYVNPSTNVLSNVPFSSVAIYKLYKDSGGNPQMDIDNSGWFTPDRKQLAYASQGTDRPLVTFLTRYPVSSDVNDTERRKLIFSNGGVDVNDIAIYQINDGTTGSNYRITFTMVQVSPSGSASTSGNSKYLINVERMSDGHFDGGYSVDSSMIMTQVP
ncbi:hypothetical protein [Chryseobacterium oryzae]|uniref:Uncharacterized protein n=1 Tax=Chryseobacterium oryzae TaxID=2929799 RepID=A0ABY4BDT3_9FLAO|nr:hypothetical protein [Chryseobacterium oryzae]UOE37287.1 hypothetical protein MTP08_09430 [Chryseobacterium oryzae]